MSKAALEKELGKLEGEIIQSFGDKPLIPEDPINFCVEWLGFTPTKYQEALAKSFVENQFAAARWCRQSGKSHIIAVLLLHYALTHPDVYIAVVGPSWRQTKLIIRKINAFLRKIPSAFYYKPQRTIVRPTNGSIIEAFPNNPDTIRGPTLHIVYCMPGYVNVSLSDGTQIPIREVKPGQQVLTYNNSLGKVEPKKVLKIFTNPLAKRKLMRVYHDFGYLDCTKEHKIFTLNRGFVPAGELIK